MIFGQRTVPGMKFEDGEKVLGSSAILRRLEEMVPEPALLPADPARRAAVEAAEAWGNDVLQPIARHVLWPALKRHPKSISTYLVGSRLPTLPKPVLRVMAPGLTRIQMKMNATSDAVLAADLEALPGHLDRIDAWIADGTLGGERPNIADLQIAATLRLLMTIGDVRPLIEDRPAGALALRLFAHVEGSVPAGVLPEAKLATATA
jgi:glutathione S-transferase